MIRLSTGLGSLSRKRKTSQPIPNATTYLFNTASPSAISSYTRATTNEFYRDNTGKFVNATANQIRYDYSFAGNPLGLRFDHVSTNKCTNTNWNMVDLTGLVKTGNATASVSISTHPVHGHPVILIDNTLGGSGTCSVEVAGTTGNTNPHSMRTVARILQGAMTGTFIGNDGGTNVKTAADCGMTAIDTDGFIFNENFTPTSSSRKLRLSCAIGCKAIFWLNQLEESAVCSFPLLVAGATATRTAASSYVLLSGIPTYNEAQGSLIVEAVFDRVQGVAQTIVQIANGTSTAETYAYTTQDTGQVRARTAIASGSQTNEDIGSPIRGRRHPFACSWRNGETLSATGAMTWRSDFYTGAPTGMTRLNIGGRGTTSPFMGWIRTITILDQFQNQNQLMPYMFPPVRTYRGILVGGQSHMHGWFRSDETKQNGGEVAAVAQMDIYYPDSENWVVRGAVNGSAAARDNDAASGYVNWHYDSDTGEFGPVMNYAKSVATAFGKDKLLPIFGWGQGSADAGDPDLKANTKIILDEFVSFIGGDAKVVIRPIPRRQDNYFDIHSIVRRQQRELVLENPSYIFEAPPEFSGVTYGADNHHMTDAGYAITATNSVRKMMAVLGNSVSGAVDPPSFLSASRSGTTVTVPITFPSGITAITPTTAISGFRAFDGDPESGGTEIGITAATYSAGNVILTLASTPAGTLYLEFGRGSLYTEFLAGTIANLPIGNGTGTLGVAWNKVIVT